MVSDGFIHRQVGIVDLSITVVANLPGRTIRVKETDNPNPIRFRSYRVAHDGSCARSLLRPGG